jgi:galactose mutarotase-like enzyme
MVAKMAFHLNILKLSLNYSETHVKLKAVSYEDEGPYDGILTLFTTYQIHQNTLEIMYEATTTETTLCNLHQSCVSKCIESNPPFMIIK